MIGRKSFLATLLPTKGLLLWLAGSLVLAGCASAPPDYTKTTSVALQDYHLTYLDQLTAEQQAANPGKSGFALLTSGNDAFVHRMGMIDNTEKTLDVQVYIWDLDETGRLFAERVLMAADRGVRVRLLVDDFGLGPSDDGVAAFSAHPNIEVRIFNPLSRSRSAAANFLFDFRRVNHRMHNKIMVGDNAMAIVGGRNMGDHYFDVAMDTNFRDLDIVAMGPIVREISTVFDYFWQGEWSVPIDALVPESFDAADLAELRKRLAQDIANSQYPYSLDDDLQALYQSLADNGRPLVWASGMIVWDDPQRIIDEGQTSTISRGLGNKLDSLQQSLTLESAYFVPGDNGVKAISGLIERGIDVRIMTNSLASNDVLAAHAGYSSYRRQLLEAGANLYELRADTNVVQKAWKAESRAGLHTKAFIFDDDSLFVGSYNLDPRSTNINTEAGVYVESKELARRLRNYMDAGVTPQTSYRVTLDENNELLWQSEENGQPAQFTSDPLSTAWQRFMAGVIRLLPIESQL
jgi:putative cardiolipin synthase